MILNINKVTPGTSHVVIELSMKAFEEAIKKNPEITILETEDQRIYYTDSEFVYCNKKRSIHQSYIR